MIHVGSQTFYDEIASHENDADLSWNVGWAYLKIGDYRAAERHLGRATQLTPTRAAAGNMKHGGQACYLRFLELSLNPDSELNILVTNRKWQA